MKAGCVALQTGPTAERMARILDPFGHQVDEHRNNLPEIVTGIADVYTDLVLKRDRQVNIKRPTGNHSSVTTSRCAVCLDCSRTDQKGEPPDLRKAPDAFLKATADGRLTAAVLQSKVDEPKSTEAASAEALQDLQSVLKSKQSVVESVRDDAKIEAERRLSLRKDLEVCCCVTTTNLQLCEAAAQTQALREELQSVRVYW
eukprot:s219_g41.t4